MSASGGSRRTELQALLRDVIVQLLQAGGHLDWSLQRCLPLADLPLWTAEDLERLESMASRYARLSDLLTQRLMRLADELELESAGSLLDRIHRAEKRGWVEVDGQLVRIRELRNLIAHEYEDEDLAALYRELLASAPVLLGAVQRAADWSAKLQ